MIKIFPVGWRRLLTANGLYGSSKKIHLL